MQAWQRTFGSRDAVASLGGDRLHLMYQPANAAAIMAAVRFEKPNENDYPAVLDLAAAEIGGRLASLEAIRRVDRYTDASMWVIRRHGEISGFLAPLALTNAGRDAMCDGSFDAAYVASLGRRILYITERAVFELRDGMLTLTEVAPGIDVRAQVLAFCPPGVRVAEPLRTMDARIFDPAPMLTRERP
jgi:hypothetical protein